MALIVEREDSPVFVAAPVTLDDVVTTTGIEYAVTDVSAGTRPTDWTAAYVLDGKTGVLVDATLLVPGKQYQVWARVSSPPESVVLKAGRFVVG